MPRVQKTWQAVRSAPCLFVRRLIVRRLIVGAALAGCCLVLLPLRGQDAPVARLIDEPPFDLLTLDKANESKVYKVYPVHLPGRKVPEKPKAADKLRIKLLENDEEYDVAWASIAKLELYEQMILAEANRFTTEGKFDEAYDEFAFLLSYYPSTPGLAESRQHYLYLSSGAAYRQQKYDEALAILEELIAQNPDFRPRDNAPTLLQRLGDIADRLIAAAVEKKEFRVARALLTRLAAQYKADGEPFVKKWRGQLSDLAARYRDEAKAHIAAGRFLEAHDACAMMQTIWPDVAGASELEAEIGRRHPLVRVGVEHPALALDTTSLYDMAARRAGRLAQRLLVECTAVGAEGGKYESPLGPIVRSDDGMSLTFRLPADGKVADSYDLAQQLLARATEGSPDYDATWSRIVSTVGVSGASDVQIDLKARHVLPEALLAIPLSSATGKQATTDQPYARLSAGAGDTTRYAIHGDYAFRRPAQPAEIVERHFSDPQRALMAIKQGEIDLLARIFPGDIASLRADDSVVVAPYAGPTTHLLAVRSQHPFLGSRTFRRALMYGANRELLLSQGLLRGAPLPGFRLVSGPFPAPIAGMELPTYGYDSQIEPRPYDPRLAMALVILSEGELKAAFEKQKKQAPKLTPIVLGHPADEISRIACRGMARDWKKIGVECKLLEFAPGVFDDAEHKCDLVYLQVAAWEPVIDARRLLGTGGIAPTENTAIQLALREIDAAQNWQQVRQRLLTLHFLLHEDETILPLWQTLDHFAYRKSLRGITPGRLRLYQDIEQWQTTTQLARSLP